MTRLGKSMERHILIIYVLLHSDRPARRNAGPDDHDSTRRIEDSRAASVRGPSAHDRRTEGRRAVGSNAELSTGMGNQLHGSNTGIRITPKAQACLPRSRLAQYADPARWCRGRNSSRTKLITSSAMNIARETGLKYSFVVQCLGWHDSCYLPPTENSGPKALKGRSLMMVTCAACGDAI